MAYRFQCEHLIAIRIALLMNMKPVSESEQEARDESRTHDESTIENYLDFE